jgi:hypothetical protein
LFIRFVPDDGAPLNKEIARIGILASVTPSKSTHIQGISLFFTGKTHKFKGVHNDNIGKKHYYTAMNTAFKLYATPAVD